MFFKKDKEQKSSEAKRHLVLKRHVADSIITYAKSCHPNEGILILQGQIKKNNIIVEGPGGSNRPSLEDLNNFYGFISIIISYPYSDGDIGAFDRNGNKVSLDIV